MMRFHILMERHTGFHTAKYLVAPLGHSAVCGGIAVPEVQNLSFPKPGTGRFGYSSAWCPCGRYQPDRSRKAFGSDQRFGAVDLITYFDLLGSQMYDHHFRTFCPVLGFTPSSDETLIPFESRRSMVNDS